MNSIFRCFTLWTLTWTMATSLKMQCLNKTCAVKSVSLENYVQNVDLYRTDNFDPMATTLIFEVEKLQTIPIEFMNDFSQLETVRANNTNMYILHSTVFGENHRESFKHLRNLVLDHNEITTLLNFTFAGADQLAVLKLGFNKIDSIEKYAFKGLERLEYLDLSHNCLKNMDWTIFANTSGLVYLNLEHNQILSHQIDPFPNLQYLYIDFSNDLTAREDHILDRLPELMEMGVRDHAFSCGQLAGYLEPFADRGVILKDSSSENSLLINRCVFNLKAWEEIAKFCAVLVLVVIVSTLVVIHFRRRRAADSPVDSKMTDDPKV